MRKLLLISIVTFFLSGCAAQGYGTGAAGSDWIITNTADEIIRQAGQAIGGYGTGEFEWSRVQQRGAWEAQHAIGRILQSERRRREVARRQP